MDYTRRLREAVEMLTKLMRCLPDSTVHIGDETWRWAWEELGDAAQEEIKAVRQEVTKWVFDLREELNS